ncbi:hypothetical protein AVEN_108980-1 [Araneus ventricosus]|uniref:Uncharacterized protein n=1 Tax=Araneus ventricosus TaxID=182803 RepID=A0A4Y2F2N7_ARAVE|nr:hypothetical protein AVEN_108980-1 [Araneus ventricosus]
MTPRYIMNRRLTTLLFRDILQRLPLHWNVSVRHHLDQVGVPDEVVLLTRKSEDRASFPDVSDSLLFPDPTVNE